MVKKEGSFLSHSFLNYTFGEKKNTSGSETPAVPPAKQKAINPWRYQLWRNPFLEHFTHTPRTGPCLTQAGQSHSSQGTATCPWCSQGLGPAKVDFSPLGQHKPAFSPPSAPWEHSLGPVALSDRRLDAAAAGPRAAPEGAPGAPGPVGHRRLSLLGHTHPKPAVLQGGTDMPKVRLCCCVLQATHTDQPGQRESASLISQPHAMILWSNKTGLFYILSVTPIFFFLHTLKWQSEGKVLSPWNDWFMGWRLRTTETTEYSLLTGAKQHSKLTALAFQKAALSDFLESCRNCAVSGEGTGNEEKHQGKLKPSHSYPKQKTSKSKRQIK